MQRRANRPGALGDPFDAEATAYEKSRKRSGSSSLGEALTSGNPPLATILSLIVLGSILVWIIYLVLPRTQVVNDAGLYIYPRPEHEKLIDGPSEKTALARRLLDWLFAHGFWVDDSKVQLKWLGEARGMGLVALKPLDVGEIVFKIPKSLFWSVRNQFSSERALAAVKFLKEQLGVQDHFTLSSVLFMTDKRNATSFWQPYIDSLPFPNGPFYWTEKEIEAAQFSSLANKRNTYMDYPIATLQSYARNLHQHFPDVFPTENWQDYYQDFCWAASTLLHRAFSDDGEWVLVPYLDLINSHLYWDAEQGKYVDKNGYHSTDGNRYWSFGTQFAYEAGQEILDTYQDLVQYGFSMADSGIENLNDYILLRVDRPADNQADTARTQLSRAAPTQKYITAELSALDNFAIPNSFLRAVIAFLANEDELVALQARHGDRKPKLTKEEQSTAINWIIEALDAQIRSWPTTLEQDDRLVRDRTLVGNMHTAISFRRSIKMLVSRAVHQLRVDPKLKEHAGKAANEEWAMLTVNIERRGDGQLAA